MKAKSQQKNYAKNFVYALQPSLNVKALREVYSGWWEKAIWSGGSFIDRRSLKSFYYSLDIRWPSLSEFCQLPQGGKSDLVQILDKYIADRSQAPDVDANVLMGP